MKAVEKKTRNAVWLTLLDKNSSLCVFFSLCKKCIHMVDHFKGNSIQQIYRIFSFLTSIFNFSYRHIFEALKKTFIFLLKTIFLKTIFCISFCLFLTLHEVQINKLCANYAYRISVLQNPFLTSN